MEYRTREEMHKAHIERRRRMAEAARKFEESRKPKVNLQNSTISNAPVEIKKPEPINQSDPHPILPSLIQTHEINALMSKYRLVASFGISDGPYKSETLKEFVKDVCRRHRLTLAELYSRRRTKAIKEARWELWYLVRAHLNLSYPHIGARCGGYDHTTVMHGVNAWKKIKDQREAEAKLQAEVEAQKNLELIDIVGLS
jgi:hypothetical protein